MSEPVIDVREATIRFGSFTAVDRVSLTVGPGEVFGLLGPNGSGKTTLIRAMCGLIPLAGGTARVLGRDVKSEAEVIRTRVGYMSQSFSLYAELTVRQNLVLHARLYHLPADHARHRIADLVERFGHGWPLNPPADMRTWYSFDAVGYTDYPFFGTQQSK